MKIYVKLATWSFLTFILAPLAHAHFNPLLEIVPSSTSPIAISDQGNTYLTYVVTNNTSQAVKALTIDPGFGGAKNFLALSISSNNCAQQLNVPVRGSCTFVLVMQGKNQASQTTLTPRICAYNSAICSIPAAANRVAVIISRQVPLVHFPIPYAGTYYPIL